MDKILHRRQFTQPIYAKKIDARRLARQEPLNEAYRYIIYYGIETTGRSFEHDEIIEYQAVVTDCAKAGGQVIDEQHFYVKASEGKMSNYTVFTTGISQSEVSGGLSKEQAVERISKLFDLPNVLLAAWNGQVSMLYLDKLLSEHGHINMFDRVDLLCLKTIYRDRCLPPHKLSDALGAYGVTIKGGLREINKARALYKLTKAYADERDDLREYVNIFGFKHGKPTGSGKVLYRHQLPDSEGPIYERGY